MTSGLALLAHWSLRQQLNVSVQFSCVVRTRFYTSDFRQIIIKKEKGREKKKERNVPLVVSVQKPLVH